MVGSSKFSLVSRVRGDGRGVAAIEFALVLPFFLMIVLGIIDYGYLFFVDLTLTNAAREGAREGSIQTTPGLAFTEATAASQTYLTPSGLFPSGLVNTASVDVQRPVNGAVDSPVIVTVSIATFEPLVGFLPPSAFPASLSVTSRMRWEMAP